MGILKKKYFISQFTHEVYRHGGVGYTDAEKILALMGYQPLALPGIDQFSLWNKVRRLIRVLYWFIFLPRRSTIIFLSPVYPRMLCILIRLLSRRKNIRLICFIADIDGVRDGDLDVQKEEAAFYRLCDQFIVHNASMDEWLKRTMGNIMTAEIDFFDFLAEPNFTSREHSFNVVFAGNLSKSPFLEQVEDLVPQSPKVKFHLFGEATVRMKEQQNMLWHGSFEPALLPGKLNASFGLVWDGDSINSLRGLAGEYLIYNSPHKLSLYILSGIPLIVPAASASAGLVRKYGIGLIVTDLLSLQSEIEKVSIEEYEQMRNNLVPLAKKISSGQRLKTALEELDRNVS
ncbi:MAG: hypothetical protein ABW007_06790 [Chitinophagaceae bacterium]